MFNINDYLSKVENLLSALPKDNATRGELELRTVAKKFSKIKNKNPSLESLQDTLWLDIGLIDLTELIPSNISTLAMKNLSEHLLSIPMFEEDKFEEELAVNKELTFARVFNVPPYLKYAKSELNLDIAGVLTLKCRYSIEPNRVVKLVISTNYNIESDYLNDYLAFSDIVKELDNGCEKLSGTTFEINTFMDLVSLGNHVPKELFELEKKCSELASKVIESEIETFNNMIKGTRFNIDYVNWLKKL